MEKRITFVGLDAHKVSTNVAVLLAGAERPVAWQVSTERGSIRKMVKKVLALALGKVRFSYEAGPCGYALQRWIRELGVECMVVAPSLIPRKSGELIEAAFIDWLPLRIPSWPGAHAAPPTRPKIRSQSRPSRCPVPPSRQCRPCLTASTHGGPMS